MYVGVGCEVFDVESRNALLSLPESDAVTSICVSRLRDELLVNVAQHVSALQEGPAIRLWELSTRRVLQRYTGHFQATQSVLLAIKKSLFHVAPGEIH